MNNNKQSGIYRIKNLETGMIYIGQTATSFDIRWGYHRWKLKAGRHTNAHLQNSYNKYGKDAFDFKVLEVIPQGDMTDQEFSDYLNEREIRLIDELDTFENGYNMSEGGRGHLGRTLSEETKAKMSASALGKKRGPRNAEWGAKLSAALMGKTMSESTKARLAEGRQAYWERKQEEQAKHQAEQKIRIAAQKELNRIYWSKYSEQSPDEQRKFHNITRTPVL